MPCGHLLGKGGPLGSRFWCMTVRLSLSHWYPGPGVVLDLSIPELCTLTYFNYHYFSVNVKIKFETNEKVRKKDIA